MLPRFSASFANRTAVVAKADSANAASNSDPVAASAADVAAVYAHPVSADSACVLFSAISMKPAQPSNIVSLLNILSRV